MTEIVKEGMLSEYDAFVASHPKGHFMQTSLWAKQKPGFKWEAVVSRGEDGSIRGGLAVLIRKLPLLPVTLMYGGRGPVCDPHDERTLAELLGGAKALAKIHRSYTIKLDPDILTGDEKFLAIMERHGFALSGGGKNFEGIQPRFVFRLDIGGKTEDEVFSGFHTKWRYNIRLSERRGVRVELRSDDKALDDFSRLMYDTGLRDGFVTRPRAYFANMLKNLGEHARLYMAYAEDEAIAGTLAIWYGDKVWYLYGASANEKRELMPNYLLQWHMIRWAIEKKCRIYDFRGVSGDLSEDNPLYGLYRFKKGFGGDFCEFVGELDCVYNRAVGFAVDKGEKAMRRARRALYLAKNRGAG